MCIRDSVYGGQADSPLNDLIEEFNETVGAEEGIKLQVTVAVSYTHLPLKKTSAASFARLAAAGRKEKKMWKD